MTPEELIGVADEAFKRGFGGPWWLVTTDHVYACETPPPPEDCTDDGQWQDFFDKASTLAWGDIEPDVAPLIRACPPERVVALAELWKASQERMALMSKPDTQPNRLRALQADYKVSQALTKLEEIGE